jgi:MoaA/NifB/PqqE/SkfB family radical SAM enzyme
MVIFIMEDLKTLVKNIGNVDFEITFNCNLSCLHCYNETHRVKNELTTEQIFDTINQIKILGFQEIHINGGEPLIHKDIIKILKHCESNNLNILLETNATLLNQDIISNISSIKNLKIRASIDGSEKIHNTIRRTKQSKNPYLISVSNLVNANKSGIPVQITTSVNNINYKSILEMVDDLHNRGIRDIRLRLSMPSNSGYDHWQILKLDSKKLEKIKEQVEIINNKYDINFNGDTIFRAFPKAERKCFITPHGNVKPYPFINLYAGNVNDSSLKEILVNYDKVVFPSETEKMMDNYLKELGMGEKNDEPKK